MTTIAKDTGHVGLTVTDLGRALNFYRAVFGLAVLHESTRPDRRYAFLGKGSEIVLTLWEQSGEEFAPRHAGLHHLAFVVPDLDAVREIEARVRAAGGRIHHGGIVPHREGSQSGGVFFEDPDGIRLEVYAPSGVEGRAPTPGAPTCGFF